MEQKTEAQRWIDKIESLVKIRDAATAELEAIFQRVADEKKRREQFKITADDK